MKIYSFNTTPVNTPYQHISKASFCGLKTNSLKTTWNNAATRERLKYYIGWYFEAYPSQLNKFMKEIEKVSTYSDKVAFDSLSNSFKSFGKLSEIKEKLNMTESFRSGAVSQIAIEHLNKMNKKPRTIIDIGYGKGDIVKSLKDNFNIASQNVTGLEVFKENSRQPFNALQYDGVNISDAIIKAVKENPLIPKAYDTALLASVLHHSLNHEQILTETHKVLTPNGILIIEDIDPISGMEQFHTVMDHILNIFQDTSAPVPANYVTPNKIKDMAEKTGFKVLKSEYYSRDTLRQYTAVLQKD